MRTYEIWYPDKAEGDPPHFTGNIRKIRNLPEGTRVFSVIFGRDGGMIDCTEYPVKGGRVIFPENKYTPRMK